MPASAASLSKRLALALALLLLASGAAVGLVRGTEPEAPVSRESFPTIAPGQRLPSGEDCAARVDQSWEPRPENARANMTVPSALSLQPWRGFASEARRLTTRIDGNYTGTTDAILQWGACKWGLDAEVVRALAFQESQWLMSAEGDVEEDPSLCPPGYDAPCPTSFGISQIKWYFHPGTFPHSANATAFNVDYSLAQWRACYEGWAYHRGDYAAGDAWGCIGAHFSGDWKDPDARRYIADVQHHTAERPWLRW